MKCTNCQNEIVENSSRCNYCGQEVKISTAKQPKPKKNPWVNIITLVFFIGLGIYGAATDRGSQKNDEGIKLLDTGGNYEQAISNFEESLKSMIDDDEKIVVLKNMGYAYWVNNQTDKSLEKFNEALALAKPETLDFYLISGEIALLNGNAKSAESNYLQALGKDSEDFQINSSLGVFYLGVDAVAKDFADYDKALIYNKKAFELKSNTEMTKENLANNYYMLDKYQEAIDLLLQTSLANKPFNNYLLGLSYYGIEDDALAYQYLNQAVTMGFEPEPAVVEFLKNYNSEEN